MSNNNFLDNYNPKTDGEIDHYLLEEAKKRGFYKGDTKYNELFHRLYFIGGKIVFKNTLNCDVRIKWYYYYNTIVKSWFIPWDEKEAICALILSEYHSPI